MDSINRYVIEFEDGSFALWGQFFCKKKCRLIKDFRKCPEYEKEDFDLILDKWICFGEYRRMYVNREFKWD